MVLLFCLIAQAIKQASIDDVRKLFAAVVHAQTGYMRSKREVRVDSLLLLRTEGRVPDAINVSGPRLMQGGWRPACSSWDGAWEGTGVQGMIVVRGRNGRIRHYPVGGDGMSAWRLRLWEASMVGFRRRKG